MENKINIAKILSNCPTGMELDCSIYNKVTLINVDDREDIVYPIIVFREDGNTIALTKYGQYTDADFAKCVIFPKGKTTWEGFQRPFKDGDIISGGGFIAIFHKFDEDHLYYRCWHHLKNNTFKAKIDYGIGFIEEYRHATEEEKSKLFQAIKDNGYKWNSETKTLEKLIKPEFKVGDRVRHKVVNKNDVHEINRVYDDSYGFVGFPYTIPMKYQDEYELVPNKFDISTLKPFDKVLVRQSVHGIWGIDFFGFYNYDEGYYYTTSNCAYTQCIPYEDNKHLLGKTDDCDEYFKNW